MKRNALFILAILMVLPFKVGWGVDSYASLESGAWLSKGQPTDVSGSATLTQSWVGSKAEGYRISTFESAYHVTSEETIEAAVVGAEADIYFKLLGVDWAVKPKVGLFNEIDTDAFGTNKQSGLAGVRLSTYLKDWIGISVGADQVFPNTTNVVAGITLTPSLK